MYDFKDAITSTKLGEMVLKKQKDEQLGRIVRIVLICIGAVCVACGIFLLISRLKRSCCDDYDFYDDLDDYFDDEFDDEFDDDEDEEDDDDDDDEDGEEEDTDGKDE